MVKSVMLDAHDRLAIHELVNLYGIVIDERDWARVPELFTADVVYDMSELGLGVIHGGKNALRFTPHFSVTSDELDLLVRVVRQGLRALTHAELAVDQVRAPEVAR